jgi:GT2 family glycosyltransferase
MPQVSYKIAVVIPTIGRHAELRLMLESLAKQTRLPDEVLIVDQDQSSRALAGEFSQLNIRVLTVPGSATLKRNAGFKAVQPEMTLVAFIDDDMVLEPEATETMLRFWEAAGEQPGGASYNLANHPPLYAQRLKTLRLASALGLYDSRKGMVLRSGIQTMMPGFQEPTYVRWLPTGAVVYSRKVLKEFSFDEWFESYSYLEDLDFSYRVGKQYKLAVVAKARVYHYPSPIGRPNWYVFGKKEVMNRLYFVSKHRELSRPLCCLALFIRALMSVVLGFTKLDTGYFKRVAGNFAALLLVLAGRTNAPATRRQAHRLVKRGSHAWSSPNRQPVPRSRLDV